MWGGGEKYFFKSSNNEKIQLLKQNCIKYNFKIHKNS